MAQAEFDRGRSQQFAERRTRQGPSASTVLCWGLSGIGGLCQGGIWWGASRLVPPLPLEALLPMLLFPLFLAEPTLSPASIPHLSSALGLPVLLLFLQAAPEPLKRGVQRGVWPKKVFGGVS